VAAQRARPRLAPGDGGRAEVWRRLRNSHGAMMAADELMRRVAAGRMDVREAGDQGRD